MSEQLTPEGAADMHRQMARDAAAVKAGEQGLLFNAQADEVMPETGYRGPVAASVVGLSLIHI